MIPPASPVPVIDMAGVGRTYAGPPRVHVLTSVDLVVRSGEFIAIVGSSGSGKSTLLNIIGLLDRLTAGRYRLDGLDTATLDEPDRAALRGRRVGFVFQSFHLLPHRTAAENVALAQLYTGPRAPARAAAARDALARVGLDHRADAMPTTMSGGERQRVAIARAIVNRPSLLLCDEPTGNLDSTTSDRVMDLLSTLHQEGGTVLVITHDAAVAARAERVVTIRDGQLGLLGRSGDT